MTEFSPTARRAREAVLRRECVRGGERGEGARVEAVDGRGAGDHDHRPDCSGRVQVKAVQRRFKGGSGEGGSKAKKGHRKAKERP